MKKYINIGLALAMGIAFASCDDLLNRNRYPEDALTNTPDFWSQEVNVQGQVNYLYQNYAGYGNGTGRNGTFYFQSLSDDQVGQWGSGNVDFNTWAYLIVPGTSSCWNSTYPVIRTCNQIITGVRSSSLNEKVKANYEGMARMNRGWQYYDLVRHYGDVPLVLEVLDPESPELYGPRTARNTVMDQAIEDIDFAINNIQTQSDKQFFSADLARAMKIELCLFEGAYAKYHQNDNARATKMFNAVVAAANELMGRYSLCEKYGMIYNSVFTAADGIPSIKNNPEVIFFKPYAPGTFCHSITKYTSTGSVQCGMSKDAFDAYLFTDGLPASKTALDTDDAGVCPVVDGKKQQLNINAQLAVRDQRLAATIDSCVFYNGYVWARPQSDPLESRTGYGVVKFYNNNIGKYYNTTDNQCYICAPLYWLAEVYLAYAEAKAELGTITDADLDLTLNKLYDRAGLPAQTVASLTAIGDTANNMGISSLLWEIRRCRRCELMMDKGQRYWDLVRWHQLELLDTEKYPNTILGANVKNAIDEHPATVAGEYLDFYQGNVRHFSDREYFYPLGNDQIALNPALTQNPGWN